MRLALRVVLVIGVIKCLTGILWATKEVGEGSVPAWVSVVVVAAMVLGVAFTFGRDLEFAVTFSLIGSMYAERFWAAQGWFLPVEIVLVPSLYLIAARYPTTLRQRFGRELWTRRALAAWFFRSGAICSFSIGVFDPHFETLWGPLALLGLVPLVIIAWRFYGAPTWLTGGLCVGLGLPPLFLLAFWLLQSEDQLWAASTVALWFTIAPIAGIVHSLLKGKHHGSRPTTRLRAGTG